MQTTDRVYKEKVKALRRKDDEAAQTAATERVPVLEAKIPRAEADVERCGADVQDSMHAFDAAEVAMRHTKYEAAGKPLDAAVRAWAKGEEAIEAARLRLTVARERHDHARGIRDALVAELAEARTTARGYGAHLPKHAAAWAEGRDLRALVRRGTLLAEEAEALRRLIKGEPVLYGQQVLTEIASKLAAADA